jgi:hypothetical protein
MILLHDLKGAMQLDHNKGMSVCMFQLAPVTILMQ